MNTSKLKQENNRALQRLQSIDASITRALEGRDWNLLDSLEIVVIKDLKEKITSLINIRKSGTL